MLRLSAVLVFLLAAVAHSVAAWPLRSERTSDRTPAEALIAARDLVASSKTGELATIYSARDGNGYPFNTIELITSSCRNHAVPLILLVARGLHARAVQRNPVASLSLRDFTVSSPRGTMDTPRMTIMGTLTRTANEDDWACFHAAHPETKDWVAHEFAIYTFERVDKVRWVGGFGDEHYVGWLDVVGYLGDAGENGTEETGMAKEQPDAMPQAVEVQV